MMKRFMLPLALIVAAHGAAYADVRSTDHALDNLPKHYAEERAPRWLETVNRQVNDLPLTDCKAFAFEKVSRLRAYGVTGKYVVVVTETGGWHAIVVVDGKWALDNRYSEVMTVDLLRRRGYQIAPLP